MQEYTLEVNEGDSGKRLDVFLAHFAKEKKLGLSRVSVQKLIEEGLVTSQGMKLKPHYKVKVKEEFKMLVRPEKTISFEPENIPLEVIYQDEDLAVINKPYGLVVHQAPGNYSHTLVNALLYHFKSLSDVNPQRPGIVHRLDKETSGLLLIAKNNTTHLALAKEFAEHSIKRKYIAIVKGSMEFDEHIIEVPIGRHRYRRKMMAVGYGTETRYAKTYYRTLKRTAGYSVLELSPFTGRTHQLRVHLAFVGHPIMGDSKYGRDNSFSRLALHSVYMGFTHPVTGQFMEFVSNVPVEFKGHMEDPVGIKKS